jgi:lysophospholipase L1-like esterase
MKSKILLSLNFLQIIVLVVILDKVGYLKFDNKKNWENSFLYNSTYKDKLELFEKYIKTNKYNQPIVFLGDSITEKIDWKELFSHNNNIINRGIGSDTISGVINRIDSIVKLNPSKVFLMIGINDISLGGGTEKMLKKYQYLIDILKKENIKIIIISTLYTQVDKYNNKVMEFNSLLKKLSLKEKVAYVNLNEELAVNRRLKDEYSFDGVHLTYKGYFVIKDKLNTLVIGD